MRTRPEETSGEQLTVKVLTTLTSSTSGVNLVAQRAEAGWYPLPSTLQCSVGSQPGVSE